MAAHLGLQQTILLEMIPGVEYARKIAMSIDDIYIHHPCCSSNIYSNRNWKFWVILGPADLINDKLQIW